VWDASRLKSDLKYLQIAGLRKPCHLKAYDSPHKHKACAIRNKICVSLHAVTAIPGLTSPSVKAWGLLEGIRAPPLGPRIHTLPVCSPFTLPV